MGSLFSSLGIEWGKLIAQIVNFGILAFILTKLVYKPLLSALEEREKAVKKISEDSSGAEKILEDAKAKQDEILAEARKHGDKILKETEAASASLRENLLKQAKTDADLIIANAEKTLSEEKDRFYGNLKTELVDLVAAGIEKTVGGYITKDAQEKLKEETLASALSISAKKMGVSHK